MKARIAPGPSAWALGTIRKVERDILGFFRECLERYGDVVTVRVGPTRRLLLQDPEVIEQMLSRQHRDFIKPYLLRSTRMLGKGLLSSDGETWVRQRRLAQRCFQPRAVEGHKAIIIDRVDRMLARWRVGETPDVYGEFKRLTLEIIAQIIFGEDASPAALETLELFSLAFEHFGKRVKSPVPLPDGFPSPGNLRLLKAIRRIDDALYTLIRERRDAGDNDRNDLLSHLCRARNEDGAPMEVRQIRDEIASFLAAGHDANAAVATWSALLLAENPGQQRAFHRELHTVLAGRAPTVADLHRLPLTEAIVLESMRLYPPVWIFGREPIRDCELGGYAVKKGTFIVVCQYLMNRDRRFFPDPEVFRPERWLPGSPSPHRYAYTPFGAGPRKCIGESLAMMESILVLVRLGQSFELTKASPSPVELATNLTLVPKGGLRLSLRRRNFDGVGAYAPAAETVMV